MGFRFAAAAMALLVSSAAMADCIEPQPNQKVGVTAKSCRSLDPKSDIKLRFYGGEVFGDRDTFMDRFYRGALVETADGQYVYPTHEANPCDRFPVGREVAMVVDSTCCDTGAWGKCIYGGRFLRDEGAEPLNVFQ